MCFSMQHQITPFHLNFPFIIVYTNCVHRCHIIVSVLRIELSISENWNQILYAHTRQARIFHLGEINFPSKQQYLPAIYRMEVYEIVNQYSVLCRCIMNNLPDNIKLSLYNYQIFSDKKQYLSTKSVSIYEIRQNSINKNFPYIILYICSPYIISK